MMWSENITDVLKHIWLLSKLFLLCPNSVDEKIKNDKLSTYRILFKFIYNIIAVFVIIYLVYTTTRFNISEKFSIVTQLADLIFNASTNASGLATGLLCLLYQNKITEVVYKLQKVDEKLKQMQIWKSYKNTQIFIIWELCFIILLWISFFLNFMFHCNNTTWKCLNKWIVLYTLSKMSQVMLMEFCAFVVVFKHKFYVINQYLKEVYKARNKWDVPNNGHYKNILNQIESIHNDILLISNEIQTIFSLPLLMKIANQFISIFCSLYFCIFGYIDDNQMITPRNFHDVLLPLLCIFVGSCEILTTVAVCELTSLEYKRTKKLLYRIPVTKYDTTLIRSVCIFIHLHLTILTIVLLDKLIFFATCSQKI